MSDIKDIDRWITVADKIQYEGAIAVNDAFVARMNKAMRRGKESVRAGTFVDLTPPISAKRYQPEPSRSPCGSSAAMCIEHGSSES